MVVCKVGTTAGTTTTGDVVIIPATQSACDNPATVRNPLPGYKTGSSTVLESVQAGLLAATNNGASGNNLAILAGSDEYLGTMTQISTANVNLNTRFTVTAATAGAAGGTAGVANNAVPYFWSNGNSLNDNTNGLFDITAKTSASTNWVIGTEKVDALMEFKLAAAADWTNDRSVMAVCMNNAGATIPSTLVMSSGTSGTGTACTAAYSW